MNHVTHAIESLSAEARMIKRSRGDAYNLRRILDDMSQSEKFLLPEDANVGVDISEAALGLIRAPYPCCCFEYTVSPESDFARNGSTKRISAVWRVSETEVESDIVKELRALYPDALEGRVGILVASFTNGKLPETGAEGWAMSPAFSFIQLGMKMLWDGGSKPIRREAGKCIIFDCPLVPVLPDFCDRVAESRGLKEAKRLMHELLSLEVEAAIETLACLSAKNVQTVTLPAPEKLNKKRLRAGKVPLFEYKTLDIFLGADSNIRRDRVKSARAAKSTCRLHCVRGHFKVRKTGMFWWSNFTRGHKTEGMVVKDYAIHTN